jgi:type II secretion system protein N
MIFQNVDTMAAQEEPLPRSKKILRTAGWVAFGLFCLTTFTLMKLPNEPIKSLIDGYISSALAQKGVSYSANEGKISFFLGLSYQMKDITLNFPPPAPPVRIEAIEVSPSLLGLIFGRTSGSVEIENAGGSLDGSFSMKNSNLTASFKSKKLNLGKLGVLPLFANIQGSGVLDGSGAIEGDTNVPSTLNGNIAMALSQVAIDAQSIAGFPIPKINISEIKTDVTLGQGKAILKTMQIGKPGNPSDDLTGTITGDITLGKQWASSTLNLKIKFSLSESLLKSFMLLDAILGAGKQPDGSYAFSLTGPIEAPMPTPIPAGGN